MSNLITHIEFAALKPVVDKYSTDKVEESITQAHSDLSEVLGGAFYFDVINNKDDAEYQELLNGGTYVFNSNTYKHAGLKSLVADYTYSRYLYVANINHTPFGMTQKNGQDSEAVNRNILKDMIKQNNKDASMKWLLIENYLQENKETFTVWANQQTNDGYNVNDNTNKFNTGRFTFLKSRN